MTASWPQDVQQVGVVAGDGPDEHAGLAAVELDWQHAGVLDRLPAEFQHQPLLRIHRRRLSRGDPEEGGIE